VTVQDVTAAAAAPPAARRALDRIDGSALRLWLFSRVSVFLLVGIAAWLVSVNLSTQLPVPYVQRWNQWDTQHYLTIAQWGYGGDPATGSRVPLEAFFPGLPIVLHTVHAAIGLPYLWAGLLVSFVAGGVAVVSLARVAALEVSDDDEAARLAERTVLVFLLAPAAVFLAAVYPESLFLALALPAWLAAKRGNWWVAGLLAAGASTVRVTGLFLALALAVEFLTNRDGRRRWPSAPALLLPVLPLAGYAAYLHTRTGDWLRPAVALGAPARTDFAWVSRLDLLAVVAGLAVTVWSIRRRKWAEAAYLGPQVLTLVAMPSWSSSDRYAMVWWPLWIALAGWTLRRPKLFTAWLALAAPVMAVLTMAFSTGRWAG